MSKHKDEAIGSIHKLNNFEYADEAARLAAVGFIATDVDKLAKQVSDNTYWVLLNHSPITWRQFTTGSGGGDVIGPASSVIDSIAVFADTGGKTIKQIAARLKVVALFSANTGTAALGTKEIYVCNSITGDITFTISSATIALGSPTSTVVFRVVDRTGNLVSNGFKITIVTEGAELIEGQSSIDIEIDHGGFTLEVDGSNVYIQNRNSNSTTQPPLTGNPGIKNIYSNAQMPVELAPDGVMRWKVVLGTRYILHNSPAVPKIWLPKFSTGTFLDFVEFSAASQSQVVFINGDSIPHIWGRDVAGLILRDILWQDLNPQNSNFSDLVGGVGVSALAGFNTFWSDFGSLGNLVDIVFNLIDCGAFDIERGFTSRDNVTAIGSSNAATFRALNTAGIPAESALFSLLGDQKTVGINIGNVQLGTNDSFIFIDAGTTGTYDIIGNSFDGVGNFFTPDVSKVITTFANDDVVIDSFSDSVANPGTHTDLNFTNPTNAIRGQTILIADEAAYNGLQFVTSVSDDQLRVEIEVVHSTSGSGTLKRTQVTSISHGFVRDQTNTISGTTNYNGTTNILQIIDNDNFIIPEAFLGNDATGTVSSTGKNQDSQGVLADLNGKAASSEVSIEALLSTNALETDIPVANALVLINATSWVSDEEIRMSLSSEGVTTYNGDFPANLKSDGNISLEPANATKNLSCRFIKQSALRNTVTFTNGTNIINETSTSRVDGDTITFNDNAGTLPAELREDIVYFVVNQAVNSFQVSYTLGGPVITFTDDGSGTNTYAKTELHGSSPSQPISSGAPRDLPPQALTSVDVSDKTFIVVINQDDSVNIVVTRGYYRTFV